VSPPKSHVPKIAKPTSLKITEEDRLAYREIEEARKVSGNDRRRMQDIFIDGLYELLRRETGKTYNEIRNQLPEALRTPLPPPPSKVTQMQRKKR
jgi:hypothetical protein